MGQKKNQALHINVKAREFPRKRAVFHTVNCIIFLYIKMYNYLRH